jgi:branched-chain amino acid transport system permease protein
VEHLPDATLGPAPWAGREGGRRTLGAFLLLGLGAGAAYALLAVGLVLVHRSTGVVHVAHGATAMVAAYVYAEARDTGDLIVPLAGLPLRLPLGGPVGAVPAVALALVVAAGLGLLLHLLVFRPLRGAPPLAGLVASIGVMVVLHASAVLQFGSADRFVQGVLPTRPLTLLGGQVPLDRLLLAAVAVAVAVALALVLRLSRLGLAVRAAAEDPDAAALLGWSPDRLAALSWASASALAGLAGVLLAPLTALSPLTFTLFVVPALAAALVGRMEGLVVAAVAGLALGAAQSLLVDLQTDLPWLRTLNLRAALPLLVVVAVLLLRGSLVPGRGAAPAARLPVATLPRRPLVTAALAVPPAALAVVVLGGAWQVGLVRSLLGALLCLSVVVVTGYVGQLSVAQMALAGVGGFALGRLSSEWGVPFPVAPVLAALVAAGAGLLLGLAARRVRGVDLAVLTLVAGVAVDEVVLRNAALTGGLGGSRVPPPSLAGLDLGPTAAGATGIRPAFGLLVLAVLTACCLLVARLRAGALGRQMLAVRVNERAAAASGVDVARVKLTAFVLAAFLAGLGGALLGYAQGSVTFESFGVLASLSLLAVAYLGGVASIGGALVGGLLFPGGLLTAALAGVPGFRPEHQLLAVGLALVALVVLAPEGLAGLARRGAARLVRDRRGGRRVDEARPGSRDR